jgi:hypothetical protein
MEKPKLGMVRVTIRVERREAMTTEDVARKIAEAIIDNSTGLTLYRVVATLDE